MPDSKYDTLGELVDRFLMRISVDKKKHFAKYLILAEECWLDIFQNTLWVIKSTWLPTKAGDPYNYIQIPIDCQRLLSVGNTDTCGLIQPLYYNPQLNIIPKPITKKCGCNESNCDCQGLCEAVNSLTVTTQLWFTINNVPYFQKKWIQYCKNGDVLEFTETPTKKYNDLTGDAGDFNSDYNDDYSRGEVPFSDFTIVTVTSQRKICKLETSPCGCPVETVSNNQLFMDCCGYLVNFNCSKKKRHCKQFSENVNDNHFGEIKISECGNKIYFRPSRHWRKSTDKEIPDYLLINYQTTGKSCGAETLVPEYARKVMYAAIDSGRKEYNSSFSQLDKDKAMYKLNDEKCKVTGYLNPIDLIFMANAQDLKINW